MVVGRFKSALTLYLHLAHFQGGWSPHVCNGDQIPINIGTHASNHVVDVDGSNHVSQSRTLMAGSFNNPNWEDDGRPVKTRSPTLNPTTSSPSPTFSPSSGPTEKPTPNPTRLPAQPPTQPPTHRPTQAPTQDPTHPPTPTPMISPSDTPSLQPSSSPIVKTPKTRRPSYFPTMVPTSPPTASPSSSPTQSPSSLPSRVPSLAPISEPLSAPTKEPTSELKIEPSSVLTAVPSPIPTAAPAVAVPINAFGLTLHSSEHGDVDEDELHRVLSRFLLELLPNELPTKFVFHHLDLELSLATMPEAIRKLNEANETHNDVSNQYEFFVFITASFSGELAPSPNEITDMILLILENESGLLLSKLNDAQDPVLKSTTDVTTSTLHATESAIIVEDGDTASDKPSGSTVFLFIIPVAVAALAGANFFNRKRMRETRSRDEEIDGDIETDIDCPDVFSDIENDDIENQYCDDAIIYVKSSDSEGDEGSFIDNVPVVKAIADSVSDNSKAKTTLGKFIPKISSRKKPKLPNEIPESNELETSKATLEVKEKKIKKKRMMSKKDKLELELQEMRNRIKELEESRGGALFSEDSYSDGSSYGSMEENDAGCFIPGIMVKSVDSRDNPGETGFDCGITSVF